MDCPYCKKSFLDYKGVEKHIIKIFLNTEMPEFCVLFFYVNQFENWLENE